MSEQKSYGNRADGTAKGSGYFGELKMPSGDVMTEYSIGVEIDGQEVQVPTVVPTLTKQELDHLLNGGGVTDQIADKAVHFALDRMKAGKPVFALPDERFPIPVAPDQALQNGFERVRGKK